MFCSKSFRDISQSHHFLSVLDSWSHFSPETPECSGGCILKSPLAVCPNRHCAVNFQDRAPAESRFALTSDHQIIGERTNEKRNAIEILTFYTVNNSMLQSSRQRTKGIRSPPPKCRDLAKSEFTGDHAQFVSNFCIVGLFS